MRMNVCVNVQILKQLCQAPSMVAVLRVSGFMGSQKGRSAPLAGSWGAGSHCVVDWLLPYVGVLCGRASDVTFLGNKT